MINDLEDDFLARLKCPHCPNSRLERTGNASLTCCACERTYPIDDGVPDLLPGSGARNDKRIARPCS